MSEPLRTELETLHQLLLRMSTLVEETFHGVITQIARIGNLDPAPFPFSDDPIDALDIEIETQALRVLALHHPVAGDLRRVVMVMRVARELERIGDLSFSIVGRVETLKTLHKVSLDDKPTAMAEIAASILHRSIDAYVGQDESAAFELTKADDEVDALNLEVIQTLLNVMKEDSELVAPAMHWLTISRQIERVADHATNIAKDVYFMAKGEIVRHRTLVNE